MTIETSEQYEGVARAGRVVAETIAELSAAAAPGVTTGELDLLAAEVFHRFGARSAPALVYGFPGCVLISVNDEAVHGIPGDRVIEPSDLVKIDVTVDLDGFVADAAVTLPMPEALTVGRRLVACASSALERGLARALPGRRTRDLGRAVERVVERRHFKVLRSLTGHGVGATIHEPPTVPNWPAAWATDELREGMVLAIEPIIAVSTRTCQVASDGWTVKTSDGSLAAHVEHTVVIRADGPEILTAA